MSLKEEQLDEIINEDEKAKNEQIQSVADLENVLNSESGLRFIAKLIFESCFIFSNAYTNDERATNFNLGRQSVGQELINNIRSLNKDYVSKLIQYQKEKEK